MNDALMHLFVTFTIMPNRLKYLQTTFPVG